MRRERFIQTGPNDPKKVADYNAHCNQVNCACEQVIYRGVTLNADVIEEITAPDAVECSRIACTNTDSLGYSFYPGRDDRNCIIYRTPPGLIVPIPTTNIMSLSEDSSVVTGFFQRSKVGSWWPWIIGAVVLSVLTIYLSPPDRRVDYLSVVIFGILLAGILYAQYTQMKHLSP